MCGYKSIMVHVTTEDSASARLALASDLAERFDAHLIGLGAGCINLPVDLVGDGSAAAVLIDIETEDLQNELRAAEKRFFASAVSRANKAEWRAFTDFPANALAREARAADLVILGREWTPVSSNFSCAVSPGDVLLRAGRPILLVPPEVERLEASRVLVAWKDTREARRAVMDSLPLLHGAERVSVLEICEHERDVEDAATRTRDVALYLSRHGIGAEASACHLREATVSAEIAHAAHAQGADLVISGGYGHARMREWVFGGVTRDLLQRSDLCCLLSH
jgi:nucleotide-binding universal stress UspA family protein